MDGPIKLESMHVEPQVIIAPPTEPVPLSFPAILRNPGFHDRYAHLAGDGRSSSVSAAVTRKVRRRDENDGKRWIRRKENDRFIGNPHIVLATRKDFNVGPVIVKSTFPEPLPAYLPRTAKLPASEPPQFDPSSANAGRFSLSLKGMRRELRKAGRRAQFLVRDVEDAIAEWLTTAGSVLSPDAQNRHGVEEGNINARPMVGETDTIYEVSRTPFQLVWSIPTDAFARYVVHCCARYYEVVSYSREVSGERLTYLLRPNVTRPDYTALASIATPPITDIDISSQFDTDSEFTDIDSISEVMSLSPAPSREASPSPQQQQQQKDLESSWTDIGNDSDVDLHADLSGNELELEPAMQGLVLADTHRPPRASRSVRTRVSSTSVRSVSSPSRSPARASFAARQAPAAAVKPESFFVYLFS